MPIPDWLYNWIEQSDDPAQDVVMLTEDENNMHTHACRFRLGDQCDCIGSPVQSLTTNNSNRDDWE